MVWNLTGAITRNHALEHATVHVLLARHGARGSLVGHAGLHGFTLHGVASVEEVASAADEALARLQGGEAWLAVSPMCGTNVALGGLLAGLLATLAIGGRATGWRRWGRLPDVMTAAIVGVVAGQVLGRRVQQRWTTNPDLAGWRIVGVRERHWGGHRAVGVETARA